MSTHTPTNLTATDARAIATEAYIYGFPLVDNYRVMYSFFQDRSSSEFKAPWNHITNTGRVYTPADTTIQTPNSDTPYSNLGADLRAEPLVLSVPDIETERYYSIQFVDLYTHNFAYVGSRTTGNAAGHFLLAGPHWQGDLPAGITAVIRCETELAFVLYRTQLFNPEDLDTVTWVQAGYAVQPLSAFLGQPAPPAAPDVDFITPLPPDEQRTSPRFFEVLNFVLQFCPTHPSEVELMARFARLGIGAQGTFAAEQLTPELRAAVEAGMADAWAAFAAHKAANVDTGKVRAADGFGTRAFLANNYLYRMSSAVLGIYGNSKEEALYPLYPVDAAGEKLTGAHQYTLRFAPGQVPPVHAFWSLTVYELPRSLLVANPLNRYLINSTMLEELQWDADGGLTLYVQHESPGRERERNWLPVPAGPFWMILRLYWPQPAAVDGTWTQPPLERVA